MQTYCIEKGRAPSQDGTRPSRLQTCLYFFRMYFRISIATATIMIR
ncbi:MAG: hypothetical protein K0R39_3221, partial [Symbiobacteriaceae bacterium]|nr:hypothetical protein [Symbiobacteriaceae bacterium]